MGYPIFRCIFNEDIMDDDAKASFIFDLEYSQNGGNSNILREEFKTMYRQQHNSKLKPTWALTGQELVAFEEILRPARREVVFAESLHEAEQVVAACRAMGIPVTRDQAAEALKKSRNCMDQAVLFACGFE